MTALYYILHTRRSANISHVEIQRAYNPPGTLARLSLSLSLRAPAGHARALPACESQLLVPRLSAARGFRTIDKQIPRASRKFPYFQRTAPSPSHLVAPQLLWMQLAGLGKRERRSQCEIIHARARARVPGVRSLGRAYTNGYFTFERRCARMIYPMNKPMSANYEISGNRCIYIKSNRIRGK